MVGGSEDDIRACIIFWTGLDVNQNFDIFDPQRGQMLTFNNLRFISDQNFATYPFVFVLPSGTFLPHGGIFVAERNFGHIFGYDPGSSEPIHPYYRLLYTPPDDYSGDDYYTSSLYYRSSLSSQRTYPTYGSAVLLPLLPEESNRARILVLGGGNENDMRVGLHRIATNTAQIFEYDANLNPMDQPLMEKIKEKYLVDI